MKSLIVASALLCLFGTSPASAEMVDLRELYFMNNNFAFKHFPQLNLQAVNGLFARDVSSKDYIITGVNVTQATDLVTLHAYEEILNHQISLNVGYGLYNLTFAIASIESANSSSAMNLKGVSVDVDYLNSYNIVNITAGSGECFISASTKIELEGNAFLNAPNTNTDGKDVTDFFKQNYVIPVNQNSKPIQKVPCFFPY